MWEPKFYTVHDYVLLPNSGKTFTKGQVMRGRDAHEFELEVAKGNMNPNLATRTSVDPEA